MIGFRRCALLVAFAIVACEGPAGDNGAGYGANPSLPAPQSAPLPAVNIAEVVGWSPGEAPTAPDAFTVARYADALDHPRWMHLLPNGDVLVAESSTQAAPDRSLFGWIRNRIQANAGALSRSANRITLLRDADADGVVEQRFVFAENLNQPFGMSLVGGNLYIANTDAVMRFPYTDGQTSVGRGEVILHLPYNAADNGHWTRDLLASPDGAKLYVSIGSSSNVPKSVAELADEEGRAAVWEIDLATGAHRIFADGLRNGNGLQWEPHTGALWIAVNERDELGDNLVPDYMTSLRDGGFYGWPYSYYGQTVDARVPANPEMVARAIAPDYALGSHTASLGLYFYTGDAFPAHYRGGAFVGQHGSWNRRAPAGYKVLFVPFAQGRPSGPPEDFLTGFLNARDQARGRPVGVAADRTGALLVADDAGGVVWRIAPK